MRPEPISRFAPDGLLQTTGEALGYLAIRRLLGSFGNQVEEHFAISSGCPFQFTIKDGEVPHDAALDNQLVSVRLGDFNADGTALLGAMD